MSKESDYRAIYGDAATPAPAPTAPVQPEVPDDVRGPSVAELDRLMEVTAEPEAPTAPTPPTPTGGAQPEADEVEALAGVMYVACLTHTELATGTADSPAFASLEDWVADEYRAMSTAAIAWARARYGGEAAALRGALAAIVREEAAVGHPACACPSCTRARAALSLTHSAAAEAVQRLVEAARGLLTAVDDLIPPMDEDDAGPVRDALKPFLPARGGEA